MSVCDSFPLKLLSRSMCLERYKGMAAVGTVPSMEKVYHLLVAGTVLPDDTGVSGIFQDQLHTASASRRVDSVYEGPI